MGSARRIILAFQDKWWIDILEKLDKGQSELGFLFAQKVPISVWWTNEPSNAAMLVGWVGGQKSLEMSGFNTDQFADVAISSLDRIFKTGESFIERQLIASHSYNWDHDPLTLGAYTYLGVDGSDAPARLSESLAGRLYFAGEATSFEGHWGTVHGAYATGIRAAREVISSR
jgi:monoamine oxidase